MSFQFVWIRTVSLFSFVFVLVFCLNKLLFIHFLWVIFKKIQCYLFKSWEFFFLWRNICLYHLMWNLLNKTKQCDCNHTKKYKATYRHCNWFLQYKCKLNYLDTWNRIKIPKLFMFDCTRLLVVHFHVYVRVISESTNWYCLEFSTLTSHINYMHYYIVG